MLLLLLVIFSVAFASKYFDELVAQPVKASAPAGTRVTGSNPDIYLILFIDSTCSTIVFWLLFLYSGLYTMERGRIKTSLASYPFKNSTFRH